MTFTPSADITRAEGTFGFRTLRIPWPIGQTHRAKALVLYRNLARAARREANVAVAYWWGVTGQTVTKWRWALSVSATEGDRRLQSAISSSPAMRHAVAAMHAKARDPVRRAKIAAARRGKPRPAYVVEAMRQRQLGKRLSAATRAKMSESHKRRGTRPPAAGRAWEPWENDLLRSLRPIEAAKQTGRSLPTIATQRRKLGLPDGRTKAARR